MISSLNSLRAHVLKAAWSFCLCVAATSPATADPYDNQSAGSDQSLSLGGGVLVKPKYEGSDEHEVIGFPLIIPRFSSNDETTFGQFRRRVSFKGIDDIRFRAIEWKNLELGPVAGYRSGRDQDDAPRLGGLGDIDDGLVVGGYAGVRVSNLLFDASATTQVTGEDSGVILRFGAEAIHDLSPELQLRTRIGTTWADDNYTQTFFGITAVQAARSTAMLTEYDTDAGFKDVFIDLNARYDLSDRWLLQIGGRYARLIGDAADSPIIDTEDQFSGQFAIGYKLNIDR